MDKEAIIRLAGSECIRQNIPTAAILAIIATESSFRPEAMRYEQHWSYFHSVEIHAMRLKITTETERQLQKFSFGCGQLMGAVLREHGFEDALPMALEPTINIKYCVQHFKKFMDKYNRLEDAISAYNQGSALKDHNRKYKNQGYVDKVLSLHRHFSTSV